MALIDIKDLRLGFGGHPLFDGLDFTIEAGERCCLVGRNGAGKTTFFRVLNGEIEPDSGTIARKQGLRIGSVPQEVPAVLEGSVRELVAGGRPEGHAGAADTVPRLLSWLELEPEARCQDLSGGLKRRVLLARALAAEPELLLLDEPTNHLDIDSIVWLENFLLKCGVALLFITHDRAFARRLASRVAELDRGRLLCFAAGFERYLELRADQLLAEEKQLAQFKKKLEGEEAWIRRGIKARRTRDEGRVKALKAMREQWSQRRSALGSAKLGVSAAVRSGDLVLVAEKLGFSYGDRTLIKDFSVLVERGDKIGLIGPNGSGKSTLLKLMLGELAPQAGSVRLGSKVEPLYFDQLREQLDPTLSVWENLAGKDDTVMVNGQSRHVLAYLGDFLFEPERARSPVGIISGGERNRLLLAKLFLRPANLLVLDEPTNDLDVETLELLAELLVEFKGTIIVVSHDRHFLDAVVTSTLVCRGDGRVEEHAGGYSAWQAGEQQRMKALEAAAPAGKKSAAAPAPAPAAPGASGVRKRNFKESKELESLPGQIEELERQQQEWHARLADPAIYRDGGQAAAEAGQRLAEVDAALAAAYARWDELESLA